MLVLPNIVKLMKFFIFLLRKVDIFMNMCYNFYKKSLILERPAN